MSESRVRENRMPGLKRRGLETERQTGGTVTGGGQPTGKPTEHEGPRAYHTGEATGPVPDPTQAKAPACPPSRRCCAIARMGTPRLPDPVTTSPAQCRATSERSRVRTGEPDEPGSVLTA